MGDDSWPKITPDRKVFRFLGDTSSDGVNDKIVSAFGNVKSFPLKRILIQFWRPGKTTAGCRVLSCYNNPCSYTSFNYHLAKYRSGCCKYYYVIDDCDDDPMTISGAPPSSAFLNHFPEAVLDLRVHRGTPLVDLALECELTCFMMLPVFDKTSCLGVVEVSMRFPGDLVVIFNELTRELKRVGLCINPPRPIPKSCKKASAHKMKLAAIEIEKALQMTFQLHAITLGQVWICYESYDRKTFLCKLRSAGDQLSLVKHFYDDLYVLPMKKGEGLIGRTLETHQPHICTNIYKLSDNKAGVYALLSANANIKSTCFVICLRSSHTGELADFLFEFFWPQSRSNHLGLMEDLFMTLREYLPSFKLASGAQLGDDELLVVDVHNSSSPIKIFTGNETPKTVDLFEGQSELNQYPLTNPEGEDDDDLLIFAFYKVDYKLFFLPSSATFENVLEKIKQEFELAGTYKIKYQVVPGEWYSLADDTCLKSCISSYQTPNNIIHMKLAVLDVEK